MTVTTRRALRLAAVAVLTVLPVLPGTTLAPPALAEPDPLLGAGTRITFASTDIHGAPITASGTVIEPMTPWRGPGPQPLVAYLVGTHGEGAQCAPSRLLSGLLQYTPPLDVMAEYELPFMYALLAQGYAVVIPDYAGLGVPNAPSYMNPVAEAHVAIDAVRAAQGLGRTTIPEHGPVVFAGYSQGGNAAGGVAEQLAEYGPDLDVKGVSVGAAPVDLASFFDRLEGGLSAGLVGYALNALESAYPETVPALAEIINPAGRAMMAATATECVAETTLRYGLHHTGEWTVSGRPLSLELAENPVTRAVLDELALGHRTPAVPVSVLTGTNDDVVPPGPVRDLAATWCGRGATVALTETALPPLLPGSILGHSLNLPVTFFGTTLRWIEDRFTGKPAPSTCG
ncbi:lipase family protein [Nocardia concava]|uniref:lipase family protein n=1 Tax=Nocardia concava TaxID=257281 RepID=UPI000316E34C|nr:lipase family protein [Nocardia concava]